MCAPLSSPSRYCIWRTLSSWLEKKSDPVEGNTVCLKILILWESKGLLETKTFAILTWVIICSIFSLFDKWCMILYIWLRLSSEVRCRRHFRGTNTHNYEKVVHSWTQLIVTHLFYVRSCLWYSLLVLYLCVPYLIMLEGEGIYKYRGWGNDSLRKGWWMDESNPWQVIKWPNAACNYLTAYSIATRYLLYQSLLGWRHGLDGLVSTPNIMFTG